MQDKSISAEQLEEFLDKVDIGPIDKNVAIQGTKAMEIAQQYQKPIPIYLWVKHEAFLKKCFSKNAKLATMSDQELDERIEAATKKFPVYETLLDSRFAREVMRNAENYANRSLSLQDYKRVLDNLEKTYSEKKTFTKEFMQEISDVLQAYLYGRDTIPQPIVKRYYQLVRKCCTVCTRGADWAMQQRAKKASESGISEGLKKMPYEEREQIIDVWNPYSNAWIKVV